MSALPLICHPSTPCPGVREFTALIDCSRKDLLVFHYRIQGDIDRLRLPAQAGSVRTDGLWNHTCFEAFIRTPSARSYFEFNFSPSSEWATYHFDAYRQAMAAVPIAQAPQIVCRRRADRLEADVELHLASFDGIAAGELELAVSAVLETQDGRISYWALAHPPGKPDFHHPDGFALRLPPHAGEAR